MVGKTCGVRVFKGPCGCKWGCDDCRVGCFNPARHRNPFFKKDFWDEDYWWRGGYCYAEYLCAECYDRMVAEAKEYEEFYSENDENYEENPEYTEILRSL